MSRSATSKRTVRVAAVTATLAAAGVVGIAWTASADDQPAARRTACVGSIRFDLTFGGAGGPSRPYVGTLTSDRTVIAGAPGAVATFVPGGAPVEFSSSLHGAWEPDGRNACRIVVEQVDAGVDGMISGFSRATARIQFAGSEFTIDGTADTFDPERNLVGDDVPISGGGSRITVDEADS
ncbi:MAG: hypothetical protein ACR2HP_14055 [Ilumatobacteraceae bacterium]